MRHFLFKLLFIFFISSYINCSADCSCANDEVRFIPCAKIYVEPQHVDLCDNAIYVQIGNERVQTARLNTDDLGIFIETVRVKKCGYMEWKCTRPVHGGMPCETCNFSWNSYCNGCGGEKRAKDSN